MYLHSEELSRETILKDYDICIVGAGAAGLAMAQRLVGAGKRVLVLAAGLPDDRGLPPGFRQKIYGGKVGDFLSKVDPLFLRRSRLHMYGGTTNHFGFWSRPLDEVDFEPRPGYRSASWPLSLDDLSSYYRKAMEFGRFGPFNFDDLPFWERVLLAKISRSIRMTRSRARSSMRSTMSVSMISNCRSARCSAGRPMSLSCSMPTS